MLDIKKLKEFFPKDTMIGTIIAIMEESDYQIETSVLCEVFSYKQKKLTNYLINYPFFTVEKGIMKFKNDKFNSKVVLISEIRTHIESVHTFLSTRDISYLRTYDKYVQWCTINNILPCGVQLYWQYSMVYDNWSKFVYCLD